jgi:hypothetical protein
MQNSDLQLLEECRDAALAVRRKTRLHDESGHVISGDDHAQEVWLRSQKQIQKEEQNGTPVVNHDALLHTIVRNVLNDGFRRLETARTAQGKVAADDCVLTRDGGEAARQLGLLLEQLSQRERLTLEYYRHNDIDFPNNNRTVLDEHAHELGISKLALSKSLSRIRAVAAELGDDLAKDSQAATTPFTFNEDDFLTIVPSVDDGGRLSLTIGLPASLSEPDSRKAPERKLLEETVFRKLLPASVSYALSGCPQDAELDDTLDSLRIAAAGLAATRFQIVRCQSLQLLARLLIECGQTELAAGVPELLGEIRNVLLSEIVKVSPRAVDLHATLHELEERSSAASSR